MCVFLRLLNNKVIWIYRSIQKILPMSEENTAQECFEKHFPASGWCSSFRGDHCWRGRPKDGFYRRFRGSVWREAGEKGKHHGCREREQQ